ncbi:hypothetical protein [Chitinimonas koreensis]|uniref:hypothetical protein n=1 Tax=Chitinimonas koreensis TaxID=356302 RepID=UPI000410392B|nr:hypothetical protein [Chitinimonas koreensis]QNM97024.1 hypothetical protein H9L41_01395 [Chitinimonas koreensis]
MIRPYLLSIACSAALLGLSGCASTPVAAPKSANLLARAAVENQYLERGFNFTGSARFTEIEFQRDGELGKLMQQLEPATADKSASGKLAGGAIDIGIDAMRSFRIEARGAVDFDAARLELAPTLRFARPNLEAALTLPMLFEGKEAAVYFDGSAIDWMLPGLRDKQGQLIRLGGPEALKKLDFALLRSDLKQATRDTYAAIADDAFTLLPINEDERREGVAYKVRLKLDAAQYRQLSDRMIEGLARAAQTQLDRVAPDNKELPAYVALLKMAMGEAKSEVDAQLLIDANGRLIGTESRSWVDQKGARFAMQTSMRISNFGQPVFALAPQAGRWYPAEELAAVFASKKKDRAEEAEAPAAVPAPKAPAKPAKPKKRKSVKQTG